MSIIGDYKAYKKYEPTYADWKKKRDIQDAQRLEYIKLHPEVQNKEDIQRGRSLIRAIDIMDEYSQKRAEDMEVATESVISQIYSLIAFVGMGLGLLLLKIKPVKNFFEKLLKPLEAMLNKNQINRAGKQSMVINMAGLLTGAVIGTIAAFPIMAWASRTEVSASRKGRFEAMNNELKNPNGFAVLTDEQIEEAKKSAKTIKIDDTKKFSKGFSNALFTLRNLVSSSKEYDTQRKKFTKELEQRNARLTEKMSDEEILDAKKDQQLLTKLVEKIDIASQDYAENAEIATQTAIIGITCFGTLLSAGIYKILNALKIKSAGKVSAIAGIASALAVIGTSIFSAQLQKGASRVGRFKVKQELMKHPEQFIYVDDDKTTSVREVTIEKRKIQNPLKFLSTIWKDSKEYKKYKKTTGKEEQKLYKAIEQLELSDKQKKDAKILQRNTFMTFNKIDEKSQKYSESVEALGQTLMYPVSVIFTSAAAILGPILIMGKKPPKTKFEVAAASAKMIGIVFASYIPSILLNIYITKEQKKASRIADMLAINELNDYRKFRA